MMAKMTLINVAVLLLLSSVGLLSEAQTEPDCSQSAADLVPCYTFLEGGESRPSDSCCSSLESAYAKAPVCLCELIGYGRNLSSSLPVPINVTKDLDLPELCNVAADRAQCTALVNGAPAGSPIPGLVPGGPPDNGASRKIPGTILSISQFAAVPAVASLLLHVYRPAQYNDGLL